MLEGAKASKIESVDSVVVAGGSSNITMVKSDSVCKLLLKKNTYV